MAQKQSGHNREEADGEAAGLGSGEQYGGADRAGAADASETAHAHGGDDQEGRREWQQGNGLVWRVLA